MIEIELKRKVQIEEAAAVLVAERLLEWLDDKGFTLQPRANSLAAHADLRGADYAELAERFVGEEWSR